MHSSFVVMEAECIGCRVCVPRYTTKWAFVHSPMRVEVCFTIRDIVSTGI